MNQCYTLLGFPDMKDVTSLHSIVHLFRANNRRCGIYLLHFAEGQYYIGQSIDVVKRFAQHQRTYPNIVGFSFIAKPRSALDDAEKELIKAAESIGLSLLNITHVANIAGVTDLELIISTEEQESWLENAKVINCRDKSSVLTLNNLHINRFKRRYNKFCQHSLHKIAITVLSDYVVNCIPYPNRTEYFYWAISCLPSTNISSWPRLATVNLAVMEVFVLGYVKNNPNQLWGLLNVALDSLLEKYGSIDLFRQKHPQIEVYKSNYRDAGQYQISLQANDCAALQKLLSSRGVLRAAAILNIRVMRKRATIYQKHHCQQLADVIKKQYQ